jgi:hypothetical protein
MIEGPGRLVRAKRQDHREMIRQVTFATTLPISYFGGRAMPAFGLRHLGVSVDSLIGTNYCALWNIDLRKLGHF